jgi:hypothetical protein
MMASAQQGYVVSSVGTNPQGDISILKEGTQVFNICSCNQLRTRHDNLPTAGSQAVMAGMRSFERRQ